MEITHFRTVLSAFAEEPSDVDLASGKAVAQIRDELIDVRLTYSKDHDLLVEENGLTYPARQWLVNRIAKLPQLADRIISTTAANSDSDGKSPFVMPTGSIVSDLSATSKGGDEPVDNTVQALIDKATTQLPGATSVMYLTSDAGEGKTTLINRVARIQAQNYKSKRTSTLIVPIPLTGRAFLTFDDAVIAALVNRFRFNYWYFDAFVHLVRLGVIVPAFDGYEEMLVEGSKGEAVSALGNLVQSLDSAGTVFVAARKAFFEYLSFRTQARLLDAIGDRSASFSRLSLCRWSTKEFCEYGRLRNVPTPEEVHVVVAARLGADHPLLTRAVLVRRLFDVAGSLGDRAALATLLGHNPHDYFFTFVDAIVSREANEKWLARVSGEVSEPLLKTAEHHVLLSQIAQEMWQSSVTSLRYEVLDVIVDLFADATDKRGPVVRQIKERLRQHSLLAVDTIRGQALSFDHEDFQNFYLGEALGQLLARVQPTDLRTFLSINQIPLATVEQAVQHLLRTSGNVSNVVGLLLDLNDSEPAFSFCKENCSALVIRLVESLANRQEVIELRQMYFSVNALSGRLLSKIRFDGCHFQPTSTESTEFQSVTFSESEFERLEINSNLSGCQFENCKIDSLVEDATEERFFDPAVIRERLQKAGASLAPEGQTAMAFVETDERLVQLDRFLRNFLRSTQIDEDVIRRKLGNQAASRFFDELLPVLLEHGVLSEVPWRGGGNQRRFKLAVPLSDLGSALEQSKGNFESFLSRIP